MTRIRSGAVAVIVAVAAGAFDVAQGSEEKPSVEAVSAVSRFTVDLYRTLAGGGDGGNIFCSPLNVATAVEMTAAGAKGETAEQIARTLHLDGLGDAAHDGLGGLVDAVRGSSKPRPEGEAEDRSTGLWTANAGWFDGSEKILPDFTARLERSYRAEPHLVDFAHSPDAARETINRWVAEQTRDKIRDLLKPEHVRPGTSFILTSAIYFKGLWAFPFAAKATTDDEFRAAGGSVPIKMMHQTATRLAYFEDDAVQVVALPYRDSSLDMLVVLPRKVDGLGELEAALTAEKIDAWSSGLRPGRVRMSLPRFKSTAEFDLKEVLSKLGMPSAFDPARADFSGITGDRGVYLSAVVHKAFVEVEETGTEAAAATAVVGVRSAAISPQREYQFRADRPFLYLIRDRQAGAVLFMGRLSRP
ncbi:serpin family protein [Planctomyces sp. SH-PL62]|uniref:serpin family protein n=1 Tax=Planctomyces sp. SH-PL62 TaxID=1636152 RepID=UPI00078E71E0|nr:serpin family protein [Planctomyces sp. SH-PL62]AMV38975.1 Serpin (serine protease inhibitor) [Planctomyces sp. SH-PL62]